MTIPPCIPSIGRLLFALAMTTSACASGAHRLSPTAHAAADNIVSPPAGWRGKHIPIKTGNLSVDLLMAAARNKPIPAPYAHPEFDQWHAAGIDTVEDYICWLPLEPQRNAWQWEFYDRNCSELEERGMNYAVYPWLHFAPNWAMHSEYWEPLVSLKNGKTTFAPSIWSPKTLALFDRFYGALRQHFGDRVKQVFIGMVADYGEVGYPIGMADWVVPAPYVGADYWCGDRLARADFQRWTLKRYGTLHNVNAAWGTAWQSADRIEYPAWTATEGPLQSELDKMTVAERGQARRRWLDFVTWYLDAMVELTGKVAGIVAKHYPRQPREIKIGFGTERCMFGADYTHYVARAHAVGYTVRSTHGKLPPYFYRRFSTAAKYYKAPLVTEPPADVTREEEVERIFKDATSGTTAYMDYPGNVQRATDLFARYAAYMEGQHSLTDVAFLFPTTDHRLRAGQSIPPRLFAACDASREWFDWDLVDERLINDGALKGYRTLIMPEGTVFERDTLQRLTQWVKAGGLLIALDAGPIETVEGDTAPGAALFADRTKTPGAQQVYGEHNLSGCIKRLGRGATALLPMGDPQMKQFVEYVARILFAPSEALPGRSATPTFGATTDGVWAALLPRRILLVNRTDQERTRTFEVDPAQLRPLGACAPLARKQVTVRLTPHSIASVELPSAQVVAP